MAIDKSNSKPWVKVTVWILTFALVFAFMGTGVWLLIANWGYWFGSNDVVQSQSPEDYEIDEEALREAYETQLGIYEKAYEDDPNPENAKQLADSSAYLGYLLYETGDTTELPRARDLFNRAIELDPEGYTETAQEIIDYINQALGE
jgi:tetratricopeptide (TPR) repeat protein